MGKATQKIETQPKRCERQFKRWEKQQRISCIDDMGQISNKFKEKKENTEVRRGLGGGQNGCLGIFYLGQLSKKEEKTTQREIDNLLRNEAKMHGNLTIR